jgi:hypothetical protein
LRILREEREGTRERNVRKERGEDEKGRGHTGERKGMTGRGRKG